MFGAINALYSGLAFAGVIYAILLQRKELRLQRKELELTRNELEGQKLQLKAQNSTLQKQNFEDTFFQLLNVQNEITKSLKMEDATLITEPIIGRSCFESFYDEFKLETRRHLPRYKHLRLEEHANKNFVRYFKKVESDLGSYFRSLHHIIQFIDNSDASDKKIYTDFIRAQLSSYELVFIFYYGLSDFGNSTFKPLIEKYNLFAYLPKDKLMNPVDRTDFYSDRAYQIK
jgi:hypothetical protein